jgi:hypothetical protein
LKVSNAIVEERTKQIIMPRRNQNSLMDTVRMIRIVTSQETRSSIPHYSLLKGERQEKKSSSGFYGQGLLNSSSI